MKDIAPNLNKVPDKMPKRRSNLVVSAIFRDGDRVLLLKRQNTSYFSGHYCLVNGSVDEGESVVDALVRECREEVGVIVDPDDVRIYRVSDEYKFNGYIVFVFDVMKWSGDILNNEPDKHSEIIWADINNLPENIIPAHKAILRNLKVDGFKIFY